MPFTSQIELPERYTLRGRIANGGMAGVWSADDELLGRPVAIKVLADHLTEDAISARRSMTLASTPAARSSSWSAWTAPPWPTGCARAGPPPGGR